MFSHFSLDSHGRGKEKHIGSLLFACRRLCSRVLAFTVSVCLRLPELAPRPDESFYYECTSPPPPLRLSEQRREKLQSHARLCGQESFMEHTVLACAAAVELL